MKVVKIHAFLAILLFVVLAYPGFSQYRVEKVSEEFSFTLDVNDEDGVIYTTKSIQSYVEINNKSDKTFEVQIRWKILSDNHVPLFDCVVPQKLEQGAKLKSYCPYFKFKEPGFYQIFAELKMPSGKLHSRRITIGVDPEKITAPKDAEADFDQFWEESLKEVRAIKPDYKLIPVTREENSLTRLYRVEMKGMAGLTLRGWLEVPKKEGKYPALLRVPGYTENLKPIDKYDDLIVFSFNTRDHGESDDTGKRGWDMWVRGMDNKYDFFYRNIILDCIQALDYLCSRDDVDTDRVAVWGGSQGGGLSFTTAALDDRVALCIADIPFLCEFPRYLEISHWNEIDIWFDQNPDQTWETMFKTLSYFDTKNLVDKITCPVFMGIGLQDDVCPPATSFVSYNYLKCPKAFNIYKYEQHGQPVSHYKSRFLKIREVFNMD